MGVRMVGKDGGGWDGGGEGEWRLNVCSKEVRERMETH